MEKLEIDIVWHDINKDPTVILSYIYITNYEVGRGGGAEIKKLN